MFLRLKLLLNCQPSTCRVVGGLWVRLGKIKCAAIWVGLCVCIAALLILRSVGILSSVLLLVLCLLCRPLHLQLTFRGLAKVAIFTTNVDAENQTLINHKCVCGAMNRHFCQTRVSCCLSFCQYVVAAIHTLYFVMSTIEPFSI